ncbi:MAG: copper chaperone [Betaproteobacteria bacterium]|jgi:copper chaperone|nr:copper chaperone [Betaproteobacteria bacterium]NBS46962.1 copper chaperone [Betaproteobacteria bacterium]
MNASTAHPQTFQVQGMTCGHCERAVTQAIKSVDPQAEVRIDRAAGRVEVQSQQPRDKLAAAIADEGYGVAA